VSHVEFVVSKSGQLDISSVEIIGSAHPLLDEEAIRVVRLCVAHWKPAEKNGRPVSQKLVIPIDFKLDPVRFEEVLKSNRLKKSSKTVVIAKTFQSIDPAHWTLFAMRNLSTASGSVAIGDTVEVVGWSDWAFFIKSQGRYGYVSWKSLKITPELDSVSNVVAVTSNAAEEKQNYFSPLPLSSPIDSAYLKIKPEAYLSLTADKRSMYVGDCSTISIAFNVREDNRVALQFYNLGMQLSEIIASNLSFDKCWVVNGSIDEINGEELTIDGAKYTTYKIYKASYCPTVAGSLTVPALRLYMARRMPMKTEFLDSLNFYSKKLSINILPLPLGATPSPYDGYPIVGKFEIIESISKESVAMGEICSYHLTIFGKGLTFPIEPPKIEMNNLISRLREIIDSDSVVHNELTSTKTFVYELAFNKQGIYDLSKVISFKYLDRDSKKITVLKASTAITVTNEIANDDSNTHKPFYTKNNFIALDASRSMEIEDYQPSRLAAVKKGIEGFLRNRKVCDIGLIAFGGDAKHLTASDQGQCYPIESLKMLNPDNVKNGTAIGDAIWLAKHSFAKNTLPKRLVIIGDGDNTAGHLTPKFAAELAKKYNIKIFAIGIGTKGLVQYGKDQFGRPNMIDKTYSDTDFKKITSITGGQFYRAKDQDDLARILAFIFK